MFDIGHRAGGGNIVLATSNDQKNTPEHMIDGKDETFWSTTGLYPQEFIMSFGNTMDLQRITISSYNIKRLIVEKSTAQDPSAFEALAERDLRKQYIYPCCVVGYTYIGLEKVRNPSDVPQTDGQLQVEDIDCKTQATHLRFVVDSGYDHFIAIHKLNIAGNAVHG